MLKHKKAIIFIVIIIIAGLVIGAITISGKIREAEDASLDLITATRGDIVDKVIETGVICANQTTDITTLVGGKVISASFNEGYVVNKDDILYTLDSKDIEAQIQNSKINLEICKENYRQSKSAADNLRIISHYSGKVQKLYVSKGDYVSPGVKIADVIDNTNLILKIPFNSADIEKLKVGDSANITLTSNAATLTGTISRIYSTTESLDGYKKVNFVEILVQNPGAIGKGEKAFAYVGSVSCNSAGEFLNLTEKSIISSATGQIEELYLIEGDLISEDVVVATLKNEAISNALNSSLLSIKQAENTLQNLNSQLSDFTIRAPIGGVVISKSIYNGDNATPQAVLATISDNSSLYVEVEIDEIFISKIKVGQEVLIYADAMQEQTFLGEVYSINDAGIAKNGVTYYPVKIIIKESDGLKIAMNVSVEIIVDKKENALLIPIEATHNNKVMVLKNNQLSEEKIITGIKDEAFIEVIDGLTIDDKIKGVWNN